MKHRRWCKSTSQRTRSFHFEGFHIFSICVYSQNNIFDWITHDSSALVFIWYAPVIEALANCLMFILAFTVPLAVSIISSSHFALEFPKHRTALSTAAIQPPHRPMPPSQFAEMESSSSKPSILEGDDGGSISRPISVLQWWYFYNT